MSKKKLVFKVSQGLAVTGLALSMGTGCPREKPIVNTVPVQEPGTNNDTNNVRPDVIVNVVESPPSTNNGTTGTNNGTTAAPEEKSPKMVEPIRVNTPPPSE